MEGNFTCTDAKKNQCQDFRLQFSDYNNSLFYRNRATDKAVENTGD